MTRARSIITASAALLAACLTLAAAAPFARAAAPIEVQEFSAHVLDESGADYTLAGGHPADATSTFTLSDEPRAIYTNLPPGLIGNPGAFPRCPLDHLANIFSPCAPATAIGRIAITRNGGVVEYPLFNMRAEHGFPAQFGFNYASATPVMIYAQLRPRTGGYGVTLIAPGINKIGLTSVTATLFGLPSVQNGTGGAKIPLISNPVDCSNAEPVTTLTADSWDDPGPYIADGTLPEGSADLSSPAWATASFVSPAVTGCDEPALTAQFKPTIETNAVQDTAATQADQPAGLHVALDFPQSNDPTNPNSVFDPLLPQAPELKDITVKLPAGVSISPSSADGLAGCSDLAADPSGDQVHYDTNNPVSCPDASKIGTVTTTSPLLPSHDPETDAVTGAEPLQGDVYVLKPHPGDLAPGGGRDGTFRILIDIASAKNGIDLKLPGTVTANKDTGQLTATFLDNPQLPDDHLEINLKPGPRASLATPTTCGTFTTTTDMVPWSTPGTPDATPSSSFNVTAGANGTPCAGTPQERPFSPGFAAENEATAAGAYSPFTVHLTRNDGEKELKAIALTMPKGFVAKLSGVPYCSEAAIAAAATRTGAEEQSSPSCPAASQVGTLTTGAGPGNDPYSVSGKAYLAGPYNGGSLSLVFITPAVAGPFDLGNVVIRAAVHIDPETAQVTVNTDAIPLLLDGVSLHIRRIDARIDRPGFVQNPTNCTPAAVTGTIAGGSAGESTANVSSFFQAAGCKTLKFAPKFTVSTTGRASRASGASLTAKVSYPYAANGAVNLTKVKVELPRQLPSRLTTLQKACTSAQFDANPAGCPAASVIGHATVNTPILPVPLTGPAYFVSHGGEAFPSLVIVLQGYGITVNLVGTTFISKAGITSTTFKTVPDVPFSTFELTLPQGKFSALGANLPAKSKYIFCNQKLVMPTELIAQNGAAIHQKTPVAITGCPKAKKHAKKAKRASRKHDRAARHHTIASRRVR